MNGGRKKSQNEAMEREAEGGGNHPENEGFRRSEEEAC